LTQFEKFIIVFLAGLSGIWKGIPLGIGLKLAPLYIGIFTALGSICTVLILYFAGDAFRKWVFNLYGKKRIARKKGKFLRFAHKYGPWGLGLITAGILGPVTSTILGLIFFQNTKKFVIILMVGIFIWSLILAFIFTPVVAWIAESRLFD
jgi:membrane protein DedA with SNARE-associated domain